MARTALILGGGIGGIVAAETLRKLLPLEDRIVVVERERDHVFAPSLLWHMTGDSDAAAFTRPLSALSSKGIELVTGELTRIDPLTLSVDVGGKTLIGDAMVVALGADYAPRRYRASPRPVTTSIRLTGRGKSVPRWTPSRVAGSWC